MSLVGDLVKGVVASALREILRKAAGTTGKRRRRRTGSVSGTTIREIEKILLPAKKQVSRKRTARARSKTKRRAT